MEKHAVVVTTINAPSQAVARIAKQSSIASVPFYIIGDSKSPASFYQPDALWYDVEKQKSSGFEFAKLCPERHYARKNIGYLLAMREGAEVIVETDDDNLPLHNFLHTRDRQSRALLVEQAGWCNVYKFFSNSLIWPRGLPLDAVLTPVPRLTASNNMHDCPIQQGLANDNPDVDAIYRLLLPLPQVFAQTEVVLGSGAWSPFNSQNTRFWRDAFVLMYLPFHCSFRMTDIWRSFVAQRLGWECGWSVLFHGPTVRQERNEHDLMTDFIDEVPGYVNNGRIRAVLENLNLRPGRGGLAANLVSAYEALITIGIVGVEERALLRAWLADVEGMDLA